MNTLEKFDTIGDINIKVYKSVDNNYSFYLESSNEEVDHVADVIDDALRKF